MNKKSYSLKKSLKSPEINYFVKHNKEINQSGNLQIQADFAKTRNHTIKFLITSYDILVERIEENLLNFFNQETIYNDLNKMVDDYSYSRPLQKFNNEISRRLISNSLRNLANANNISHSKDIQHLDNFLAENLINIQEFVQETNELIVLIAKANSLSKENYITLLAKMHYFSTQKFGLSQLKIMNQKYYLGILDEQDRQFFN